MFSSNQNVQYPVNPIFREYIAKFMIRCIQSANEKKPTLLLTNAPLKNTGNSGKDNTSYPSSNLIGCLIFLSISTGIYLFISRKK